MFLTILWLMILFFNDILHIFAHYRVNPQFLRVDNYNKIKIK